MNDSDFVSAVWYAQQRGLSDQQVINQFTSWNSSTIFSNEQLSVYVKLYFYQTYLDFKQASVKNCCRLIFGTMGLFGFLVELVMFHKNPMFNVPSFLYQKAIAAIEIPVMIYHLWRGIAENNLFGFNVAAYCWLYNLRQVIGSGFSDPFAMTADTITLFIMIERLIALWWPSKFHVVNRNYVVLGAIILSAAFGSCYMANFASVYYSGCFVKFGPNSPAWFFALRDWTQMVKGIVVAVLGCLVAVAFCKLTDKGRHKTNSMESVNRQLCVLSICCAIPVVIQAAFDTANYEFVSNPPPASWDSQLNVEYTDAMQNAQLLVSGSFFSFFLSLAYMISHCFHFYVYFLLSKPFRRAVLLLFGFKNPSIAPNSSVVVSLNVFSKRKSLQKSVVTHS